MASSCIEPINQSVEELDKQSDTHSKGSVHTETTKSESTIGRQDDTLIYSIEDNPPWFSCIGLGFQHYLVAVGSLVGLPLLVAPEMCVPDDDEGNVARALLISSLFFVSGICTVLQTTFGVRLPIMQGGTFSFFPSTLAILALSHNQCPDPLPAGYNNSNVTLYNDTDGSIIDGTELWQRRMRQIQGAIAVASLLQILLSVTGAIGFILRFIGPLTVAPAVALIGLDLFSVASSRAQSQWGIAFFTAAVLILSSQYLSNIKILFPRFSHSKKLRFSRVPIFKMFPVLLALILGWLLCCIFTATDVFSAEKNATSYRARTDVRQNVISNSPWFYWPYPFQWGLPTVSSAGCVGMLSGVLAGLIDSIGDYYACARLCGAPNPPNHAINRGVLVEGFGCVLAGVIGTGTATTSFSENIGAIGITRVGSRRVLQVAGVLFVVLGVFSKFGSIFVLIPDPVIGGLFFVTFGMITAVGISNLQYVDMNSPRNIFVIGISLFMGLAVPEWMKANSGVINTSITELDQIITVLLQTAVLVGGVLAFFFDNTIPGTEKERGMISWRKTQEHASSSFHPVSQKEQREKCYNLPFPTNICRISKYLPFLPEYDVKTQKLPNNENIESYDAQTTEGK